MESLPLMQWLWLRFLDLQITSISSYKGWFAGFPLNQMILIPKSDSRMKPWSHTFNVGSGGELKPPSHTFHVESL